MQLPLAAGQINIKTLPLNLVAEMAWALILFVIALVPRLLALTKFITADEPRWATRSMDFLTGLLTANWPLTLHTGHPGVTTMWSGSIGLVLDYLLNHQAAGSLLAFVQSLPTNYQRIDPTILPWMRLPIAILASLSVVAVFWLLRPVNRHVAMVAALLLAFHPLHLAHSQLLHHDALVSAFLLFSILFYLTTLRRWSWTLLTLSGVMAGLAILSKSTAYALPPFVALVMVGEIITGRQGWAKAISAGLFWGGVAGLTVFLFWPALWVIPVQVYQTVFGFASEAADAGDVGNTLLPNFSEGFPDLGLFFYLANWLLKTTPLMMAGLLFFIYWWKREARDSNEGENPESKTIVLDSKTLFSSESLSRWWANRLLLWIALFSLMLTLGDKRDGRYLLPIYFALCILAAFGLITIYQLLMTKRPFTFKIGSFNTNLYQIAFVLLLPLFSLAYYPYYLAYYNPLVGGPWLAPKLIRVGWGDGMEEAAAWLNQQPNAEHLRVATIIEQSFWPYFAGQITPHDSHTPHSADYVLNYVRQIQNGVPFNEYWLYYQARPPAFKKSIAGIDYVWLHREPPLASVGRIPFGDNLILRAFTTSQPLATPGQPLTITLIWRVSGDTPPNTQAQAQLRDASGRVWAESLPAPVIDPQGPSPVEGHYTLNLPPDMPRGMYQLWVAVKPENNWSEVAKIPVGFSQPPQEIPNSTNINFAYRIALRGYGLNPKTPQPGQSLTLTLHWQTLQPIEVALTTFVHLLDAQGNIVAQTDTQPGQGRWPTNTWQPNEWFVDSIPLNLPAELPPGEYRLVIGWYHAESGQRLPLVNNESESSLNLSTITVQE
jgi:hypothetical protein